LCRSIGISDDQQPFGDKRGDRLFGMLAFEKADHFLGASFEDDVIRIHETKCSTVTTLALVDQFRALPTERRAAILATCTTEEISALEHCWRAFWSRPDVREADGVEGRGQLPPPPPWTWWASIGGRGSGKTRSAGEWIEEEAERLGHGCIIHLVGSSIEDAQATMVEGDSGLLAIAPPWAGLDYKVSKHGGTLTWRSGARARIFGADKPSKGRGPQCNRMWLDDPAAFGPHGLQVLEQLLWGFRLRAPDGSDPCGVISSTPIESELMDWILNPEGKRKSRIVYSRSETDDNRANLSETFFTQTVEEFAGTELEQQERFGRLDRKKSKVFAGVDFGETRVTAAPPYMMGIAVWADPAISTSTKSCEVGLHAAGIAPDGHVYLLEDGSEVLDSNQWPDRLIGMVERWRPYAAGIHAGTETNRGGNMAEGLIRSAEVIDRLRRGLPGISVLEVRTVFTAMSKATRATALPRLFKAGQVHIVGRMDVMERQLRDLDDTVKPGRDRADAAVYAILDLIGLLDMTRPGAVAMMQGARAEAYAPSPPPLQSVVVGQDLAQARPFQFGRPAAGGTR
jgi:phage terminase large subunit-like protein